MAEVTIYKGIPIVQDATGAGGAALEGAFKGLADRIEVSEYDPAAIYEAGVAVTVFGLPFVSKVAIAAPETFAPAKWTCLVRGLRTGVVSGGASIEIDGADPTLVNVTGVIRCIRVDVSPVDYQVEPFEMQPLAGVPNEHLLTGGDPKRTTHFYVQSSGAGTGQVADGVLVQSKTNRYQEMIDGAYLSFTENDISNMIVAPIAAYSGNYATLKTYQGLGGQVLDSYTFANGTLPGRLSMVKEGDIYGNGVNYVNDPTKPDAAAIPIQADFSFRRSYEISGVLNIESASSLVVDPENYNPGEAAFDPVPTGKITIQRLYVSGAAQLHVLQYGRTLYDTLDEAKQKYDTSDSFAENGDLRNVTAFAGWIFVQQGVAAPIHIINACQTSQTIGRGRPSGVLSITPAQLQSALAGKSTGLFSGGELSGTVGQTTATIAFGTGQVIDNAVPGVTTEDPYDWDDFVDVPLTELATSKHTYMFLKKVAGVVTVVQIGDSSVITEIDRKGKLYLGVIRHGTGAFVGAISQPQTVVSPANKLIDFYIATGKVRLASGNEVAATGAGLSTIDKGLGKSYGIGVNAFADGNNTDFVANPAIVAVSMLKYSSVGHIDGALISAATDSRYDPNGATTDSELVALVGGGARVVHRIWIEAVSNLVIFQYGQASYATEDDARAQWRQEDLSLPTGLNESSYMMAGVILQNGATNLDGAVFIPIEGVGGSGGQVQPTNVVDDLLSTDPNSALSANQGRLLDGQDIANADLSGTSLRLLKKGGGSITVLDAAANVANSNLTLNADRTVELAGNSLTAQDGANVVLNLSSTQAAIGFLTNFLRANAGGLELGISGTDDLQINGSVGVAGQAFLTQGNNLPPVWAYAANMANSSLVFDLPHTVDLDSNSWVISDLPTFNTMFVLDPGSQSVLGYLANNVKCSATGIDLDFNPIDGELLLDGVGGTEGQVPTAHGPGNAPTWEPQAGGAGDNFLSVASATDIGVATNLGILTANSVVAPGYEVIPISNAFFNSVQDPSSSLHVTGNYWTVPVTGTYLITGQGFDHVGSFTQYGIVVEGVTVAVSTASRETTNGEHSSVTYCLPLIAGDRVEFAMSSNTSTTIRRPTLTIVKVG